MAASRDLRRRLVDRLRGSEPGGDPLAAWSSTLGKQAAAVLRSHIPPLLTPAAVMVPVVDRRRGLSVLLTQRAGHLKHHAGQVSFPGGRIERRDASPWEAALRETEEEIGLARERVRLLGFLSDQLVLTGYRITPAVALVKPGFDLKLDRSEVDEVFEVPLSFLLDPAHRLPRERHIGGISITVHDFDYEGRNIWGATAGMLVSLCALLAEDRA